MDYTLLEQINSIEDLKRMKEDDLPLLCEELRAFMIETVAQNGGHLASSLGAVELIVAMHRVFDSPKDKLIFDVGHQAYAHKILTGRREAFKTLRTEGGLSGFPKREESEHDAFNTGHASTAISAALGYARAMRLNREDGIAVALVGDGSMTGGLVYEAMDDAGRDKTLPLIIILNDNEMSIAKNVGGVTHSFASMRTGKSYLAFKRGVMRALDMSKVGKWLGKHMDRFKNRVKHFLLPNLPFEDLGMTYIGPVDGHNIHKLIKYLERVKAMRRPVILHTMTKKGKGYAFAAENPERFHGVAPFSIETGEPKYVGAKSCSEVFGKTLCALAEKNPKIVAVTAAMPSGTGLSDFAKRFPSRFFDVGIAEEHAVTMAAGMAAGGLRPVIALYSSFLQRGYDELLHDVCLQNLPVVIGLDRAGLVGEDGETHQGVYDPAYLWTMPNIVVYSPATMEELCAMLETALTRREPAVVRYNRGCLPSEPLVKPIQPSKWQTIRQNDKVTILATGTLLKLAETVADKVGCGVVHMRFLKPMDDEILSMFIEKKTKLLVLEESIAAVAPRIALRCEPCIVRSVCVPDKAVTQGSVCQQRDRFGLNEENVMRVLREMVKE